MNIGPTLYSSAAGTPLQGQAAGTDSERQQAANQGRQIQGQQQAQKAAGVGQAEQDQQASDRDADGRRLWEDAPRPKGGQQPSTDPPPAPSQDPTGQSGTHLDLQG